MLLPTAQYLRSVDFEYKGKKMALTCINSSVFFIKKHTIDPFLVNFTISPNVLS